MLILYQRISQDFVFFQVFFFQFHIKVTDRKPAFAKNFTVNEASYSK